MSSRIHLHAASVPGVNVDEAVLCERSRSLPVLSALLHPDGLVRLPDGVPLGDRRLPARSSLLSALPSVPSYECATRYLHRATLSAAVRAMKTLMNLPPLRSMLRTGIHSTVIFASMYILLRACSGHASLWLILAARRVGPGSSRQNQCRRRTRGEGGSSPAVPQRTAEAGAMAGGRLRPWSPRRS